MGAAHGPPPGEANLLAPGTARARLTDRQLVRARPRPMVPAGTSARTRKMSGFLRQISLKRLLLLCAGVLALGVTATAAASSIGGGATPPHEPLATAVHEALAAKPVEGVSAQIQYSNHLLEGASLASGEGGGGELASSPLITGASGRLWISKDGRVRLELQSEKGDTEVLYDGHVLSAYVPSSNTLYRVTLPQDEGSGSSDRHAPPSVAQIEEGIAHLERHLSLSGVQPGNIAGQPAYTARVAPREGGSLIGGLGLSWDAAHGIPLRAAVYSSTSSSPVMELAATEISYGPVEGSVFEIRPPAGAKVVEPSGHRHGASSDGAGPQTGGTDHGHHTVLSVGHGITAVHVLELPARSGAQSAGASATDGLQKVDINGASASELATALGTILSFERGGVDYVVAGVVKPAAVEAAARGL